MWSVWGGRGNNCDKNNWRNLSVTFGVDSMPNWISIRPKNSTKGECNTARDRERERDAIMETTDFQALKVIDLKCSWYLCEILWQFMATSSNYSWSMINWSRNCYSRDCDTKVALLYVSLSPSLPLFLSRAFELPLSSFSFPIQSGTKTQRTHFVRLVVCFGHWQNSKLPMAN